MIVVSHNADPPKSRTVQHEAFSPAALSLDAVRGTDL